MHSKFIIFLLLGLLIHWKRFAKFIIVNQVTFKDYLNSLQFSKPEAFLEQIINL